MCVKLCLTLCDSGKAHSLSSGYCGQAGAVRQLCQVCCVAVCETVWNTVHVWWQSLQPSSGYSGSARAVEQPCQSLLSSCVWNCSEFYVVCVTVAKIATLIGVFWTSLSSSTTVWVSGVVCETVLNFVLCVWQWQKLQPSSGYSGLVWAVHQQCQSLLRSCLWNSSEHCVVCATVVRHGALLRPFLTSWSSSTTPSRLDKCCAVVAAQISCWMSLRDRSVAFSGHSGSWEIGSGNICSPVVYGTSHRAQTW